VCIYLPSLHIPTPLFWIFEAPAIQNNYHWPILKFSPFYNSPAGSRWNRMVPKKRMGCWNKAAIKLDFPAPVLPTMVINRPIYYHFRKGDKEIKRSTHFFILPNFASYSSFKTSGSPSLDRIVTFFQLIQPSDGHPIRGLIFSMIAGTSEAIYRYKLLPISN